MVLEFRQCSIKLYACIILHLQTNEISKFTLLKFISGVRARKILIGQTDIHLP